MGTALITGASSGIGADLARQFHAAGHAVILVARRRDRLENLASELGAGARVLVADLVDPASPARIFAETGPVDILINNAAIDPKVSGKQDLLETSRLEGFPLDQWNQQIAVGLTGAFICSQVFGASMAKDGNGGVILNIASDLSVFSPDHRLYRKDGISDELQPVKPVTYSVIKTGLVGMTRYLATYWADKGVRSNALSPGGVFNGQNDEFVQRLSSLIPLGRMARSDEYRAAVQFLCSDASAYMNGQNIVIDGGRSAW